MRVIMYRTITVSHAKDCAIFVPHGSCDCEEKKVMETLHYADGGIETREVPQP